MHQISQGVTEISQSCESDIDGQTRQKHNAENAKHKNDFIPVQTCSLTQSKFQTLFLTPELFFQHFQASDTLWTSFLY